MQFGLDAGPDGLTSATQFVDLSEDVVGLNSQESHGEDAEHAARHLQGLFSIRRAEVKRC
ncbi:hypothetical protein NS226_13580 [Aureimonas ureilytica]|uniref:Uncharacterized protein n=1 Tax=Aureimonas ureilytica TaxID=401562 RepID=A0A175R8R4_9HYPH|nr:hypothetical protein NS226_13580 [Aureimonas ureilytica]